MESINPLAALTCMKGGYDNMAQTINIIILTLILAIMYFIFKFYQEYKNTPAQNNQTVQIIDEQSTIPEQNIKINIHDNHHEKHHNPYREYDYRALYDPLVAPRRRDDSNLPVLPLPTRGYPTGFKKMGMLINKSSANDDKYKILLLMGRQTYPNSNTYEYYAIEDKSDTGAKFVLDKTREIQTDDVVNVKDLGTDYTATIDKMLGYSYDPYLY